MEDYRLKINHHQSQSLIFNLLICNLPIWNYLKKMKKTIIICLAVLLFASCKKEQPEMSTLNAGCDCAEEVKSKFEMLEMTSGNENFADYTDTDSIFGDKNVLFKALTENAEYTWYIGTEVLNTREVKRFFPNSMIGQTVPITLVTKKKANTVCFPNDDGYDSVVKYLTIAQLDLYNNFDTTRIEGYYKVKSPLLNDSIILTIDYIETGIGYYYNFYNYNGVDSNCIKVIGTGDVGHNYRQLFVNTPAGISNDYLQGTVYVGQNNSAELDLTTGAYIDGVWQPVVYYWKYKGRKL